jgi:hypothetical protein
VQQRSQFHRSLVTLPTKLLAAPETNLFLFAFLLNFVYEVWQAPYYTFYNSPTLAEKIRDLTHCTFGDGVIILMCYWVVSAIARTRYWILQPTWQLTAMLTSIGLIITLLYETYRVNVTRAYGVPVLAVPGLGMSWLAVLQWVVLPPVVIYLARRHMLGYRVPRG